MPTNLASRLRPPTWAWLALAALLAGFALPLWRLGIFAYGSSLDSHILLVPFITAYLIWLRRSDLPAASKPSPILSGILALGGVAILAAYWIARWQGDTYAPEDELALTTTAFLLLATSISAAYIDLATLRGLAFPIGFLVFMVPMPSVMREVGEGYLQEGSAVAAHAFFSVAGTPVLRNDLVFQLPGFALQIAPECSGIHSTLALCLTSLVAGYMLLHSRWNRAWLALAVIPLALLRNGFRVFVIGELCVHVGPHMIDSPIHHHGGPLFFALSLIPFGARLAWLVRRERRGLPARQTANVAIPAA